MNFEFVSGALLIMAGVYSANPFLFSVGLMSMVKGLLK